MQEIKSCLLSLAIMHTEVEFLFSALEGTSERVLMHAAPVSLVRLLINLDAPL